MKNYLRTGLFLFLFLLFAVGSAFGAEHPNSLEKRVLILYSFTINFAPDFQFVTEFTKEISSSGLKLRVKHVELDAFTREKSTDEALSRRLAPLLPDIRRGHYDVIIPIGQIAINLLCRHSKEIPEKTAIAFCGLDIVTKELFAAHPNTTGALGRVSVAGNIELGLHFYPKTKRIILLSDWSIQGKRVIEAGKHYEESYPGIEYIYLDNATTKLNDMLALVRKQNEHTLVLFYAWFNNDSTNLSSLQYIMSHLEQSKTPVFALQEPMLWEGAIGGVFTSITPIGKALAKRVKQILSGEKASNITMAAVPLATFVSSNAIETGRISSRRVPENAVIVGKKEFIRNEDLPMVIVVGIAVLALLSLSVLVSVLFFRLRSVTRKTGAILARIPGKIVISDIHRNLLFIHSGDLTCDNSTAKLKLDALPAFNREQIFQPLQRVFSTGKPERFECDFDGRRYSIELVKISSEVFGVEAVLWGMNDIDECHRIRLRLDEELCKSRLTLDSVGDAVIVTDEQGRVNYLNPAAHHLLSDSGELRPGLLLNEYFTLIPEKNSSVTKEFILGDAVIREETVSQMENYLLRLPGGTQKNVIFSLAPVKRPGEKTSGSVLTIRDVSRLKNYQEQLVMAAEKAQNADKIKSAFLATMSHELRTPLNAVIGFSEIMQQGKTTPEEEKEYLSGIYTAGKALLNLINDVLDLSKIEAGQMTILSHPTDIAKLAGELNAIFTPAVKSKGIYLHVECPDQLPPLQIDDMHVRQILLNLLGNAVKFTQNGGITMRIEYIPDPHTKQGTLSIHVIDTGPGVIPEARETIFEPFIQQNADRDSRLFKGTGLGLAISRRLAEQMDGTITLQSEEGKGSDFILLMRHVAIAKKEEPASPVAVLPEELPETPQKIRILLVDDVPINLKVLEAMLRKLEVESLMAASGAEALELLKHEHVDLVLTDMWMPGMNGAELAEAIRMLPGRGELSVIAVTADTESGANFPQEYLSDILLKPVTLEKLEKILDNFQKRKITSNKIPSGIVKCAIKSEIPIGAKE